MRHRIHSTALVRLLVSACLCYLACPGLSAEDCSDWCGASKSGKVVQANFAAQAKTALLSFAVQPPTVLEEPPYTRCDCNWIYWECISDPTITHYKVEWSTDSLFATCDTCSFFVLDTASSHLVTDLPPKTIYYRVFSYVTADTHSPPSNVVSSIQDGAPPLTSCEVSVTQAWSSLDSFSVSFQAADSAGIDSIFLYYRTPTAGEWTRFDSLSPAGAPAVYEGTLLFSTAPDSLGDNRYEFFVGAKDNAKAPDWSEGNDQSAGNSIRAEPDDNPMSEISVDTQNPHSTVGDLDSLYTSPAFDIPFEAHDSIPGFHSGLDTVYLFWGVDSGAIQPTTPLGEITFDSVAWFTDFDDSSAVGSIFAFEAIFDSSIYYFYAIAVDKAGNRQAITTIHSTRVFTDLQVTLAVADPNDPEDTEYTAGRNVLVTIDPNVSVVDSLVLCENADFTGCSVDEDQRGNVDIIDTSYTFSEGTDGSRTLYVSIWAHGKQATGSAVIVLDTQDPILSSIDLSSPSTGDSLWTRERQVSITVTGADEPRGICQLIVSEDDTFTRADTLAIEDEHVLPDNGNAFDGRVVFTLSATPERKVVHVRLLDRAEHVSAVFSDTIDLFAATHNYPNPFDPARENTNLLFVLSKDESVTILIYDLFGNLVLERTVQGTAGLNDGRSNPDLQWDGQNGKGVMVASGGYICVLNTGGRRISKHKIAVIK